MFFPGSALLRRNLSLSRTDKGDTMAILCKGATCFLDNKIQKADILIENGNIVSVGGALDVSDCEVFDCSGKYIFPGFVDVHVHFREPGFSYKETIRTGSMAAAHGGYTAVCTMPNLSPAPDTLDHLQAQLDLIDRDAVIRVYPYGTITKGEKGEELSDMEDLADRVIAFSDDGRGVQRDEIMEKAMMCAKRLHKIIAAHCEVNELLRGGYIHDGRYAALHGHKGICSESEWRQIERDIALCKKTGVRYHVCHISTKESVALIRKAKADGVNITCETAPHYLVLDDMQLKEDGRFKMNPPVRSKQDGFVLIEGLLDGTIDMIATDHAPHSAEEKAKGLAGSMMGVTGLETAFPILYTELVMKRVLPLEKLIPLMSTAPATRFGLKSGIKVGNPADLCIYDLNTSYKINPDEFLSKGKATPFAGRTVYGKCVMTLCGGKIAYKEP